jgi:hypothetical protein
MKICNTIVSTIIIIISTKPCPRPQKEELCPQIHHSILVQMQSHRNPQQSRILQLKAPGNRLEVVILEIVATRPKGLGQTENEVLLLKMKRFKENPHLEAHLATTEQAERLTEPSLTADLKVPSQTGGKSIIDLIKDTIDPTKDTIDPTKDTIDLTKGSIDTTKDLKPVHPTVEEEDIARLAGALEMFRLAVGEQKGKSSQDLELLHLMTISEDKDTRHTHSRVGKLELLSLATGK